MPREQINYPRVDERIEWNPDKDGGDTPGAWLGADGVAVPANGEPIIITPPTLHVGWHRESWVQLSIEGDVSYFRFAAENPDATGERSTVYTEPLSRDEINKLIRSLRKARDQVFGRDE